MNDREASQLLHEAAGGVDVRPAPLAEIRHRGGRRRRRRRAVSAVIAAAVVVGSVVAGMTAVRLGFDRSEQTSAETASLSPRQLAQGQWRPLTVFGRDVRRFRTIDATPAYVTFGPVFVSELDGFNDGGARYRISADGRLTTGSFATSVVGCASRGRACPTVRNREALQAARQVQVRGDRLLLLDDGGDVIATYERAG